MYNGTTCFKKIAVWLSLWMQIFNHSRYQWEGNSVAGKVFPSIDRTIPPRQVSAEDIFNLLGREGIELHPNLRMKLFERRLSLKDHWAKVLPKRVEQWEAAGWYDEGEQRNPLDALQATAQRTVIPLSLVSAAV